MSKADKTCATCATCEHRLVCYFVEKFGLSPAAAGYEDTYKCGVALPHWTPAEAERDAMRVVLEKTIARIKDTGPTTCFECEITLMESAAALAAGGTDD